MSDMEWEDTGPVLLRCLDAKNSLKATGSDLSLEDSAKAVANCDRTKGGGDGLKAGVDQPDDNERPSKRRKHSAEVHSSTVRVIYKNLTRESRNMLQALLKQWSEWSGHGAVTSEEEFVENGDDLFFPALEVGPLIKAVPVWMDRPLRKGGKEQALGGLSLSSSKEREAEIPLYDRICNPVSPRDSPVRPEGSLVLPREPSRCFNCGSYSHALKDCPRPRDQAVINNARKQKAGASGGPRPVGRYYQISPGGKFDGIKPGILGRDTRKSLGIGEWDPPPWLNRMRQLGYPPGYLVEEDDDPSGVMIFGAEEDAFGKAGSPEDGEIRERDILISSTIPVHSSSKRSSSFNASNSSMTKRMVVEYAGLNAPVPEMGDKRLWAAQPSVHVAGTERPPYLQHTASAPLPCSDGTSPPGYQSPGFDSPSQMQGGFSPGGYPSPMSPLLPSPTREYSPIRTHPGHGAPVPYRTQYEHYATSHSLLATEPVSIPALENTAWVRAQASLLAYNSRLRSADYQPR